MSRPLRAAGAALALLAVVAGCLLGAGAASAHEVRPAYLQVQETAPDEFTILWKQPANGTLALHLEPRISNHAVDGKPSDEFTANSFVIRRWDHVHVTRDSFDGATIRIEGLENTITDALVSASFLTGQEVQAVLKADNPSLTVALKGTGKLAVPAYLGLGVEHILTGYDHLSFVLGLLLLIRGRWRLLKTITAFTVAHSITLATAALGNIHPSAPVIESLVALSIVFVAIELVHDWQGKAVLTARFPWLIAFTFGLLHGFAFAGSLADIGLPPHNIPAALLLFNCGVEIGQLLFVSAALAVIWVLHRIPWQGLPRLRWATPYAIGALASYWMFERLHTLIQNA
jgi:hydrogenase/urease accessory protein HupE